MASRRETQELMHGQCRAVDCAMDDTALDANCEVVIMGTRICCMAGEGHGKNRRPAECDCKRCVPGGQGYLFSSVTEFPDMPNGKIGRRVTIKRLMRYPPSSYTVC